jgi:hypothetical protein
MNAHRFISKSCPDAVNGSQAIFGTFQAVRCPVGSKAPFCPPASHFQSSPNYGHRQAGLAVGLREIGARTVAEANLALTHLRELPQQHRKNYRAARPGPRRATHCMTLSV